MDKGTMELLHMSQDPLPMSLPLLPPLGIVGLGSAAGKPAPLKASSLSRMEELQQYLRTCDDQNNLKRYIKMLSSLPRELLDEYIKKAKARSAWLSAEEQKEYKRAKLLNVMGVPAGCGTCDVSQTELLHSQQLQECGAAAAEADAFCSQFLLGGEEDEQADARGGAPAAAAGPPAAVPAGLPVPTPAPLQGSDLPPLMIELGDEQLDKLLFEAVQESQQQQHARQRQQQQPAGQQQGPPQQLLLSPRQRLLLTPAAVALVRSPHALPSRGMLAAVPAPAAGTQQTPGFTFACQRGGALGAAAGAAGPKDCPMGASPADVLLASIGGGVVSDHQLTRISPAGHPPLPPRGGGSAVRQTLLQPDK